MKVKPQYARKVEVGVCIVELDNRECYCVNRVDDVNVPTIGFSNEKNSKKISRKISSEGAMRCDAS